MTNAEAQLEPTVDAILQAGQLVDGEYRVEYLLGEGGMAAVWAGTNERTGKRVALKFILRSLAATCVAQGLFQREALAASLVNHPNVVTVFDVIEHEGMPCIVMELLEGEPLSSYIARTGFLSVSEVTMLLVPAMRGVAAAHAQGVIHRDLKPQNIFICIGPDGRIVTTKVLDFGISVMVEHGRDASAGPGLFVGTPAYMSPEHILGVADIDGRADVYGFGVLLYEALTGKMAFPGDPSPVLFDHVLNKPAPPVTLLRADLSPGLVRIIETAMAKDRNQRYPDLHSMVRAVEDELKPPAPARRSLTPQAGVPSLAVRGPVSGTPAPVVQAVFEREPSGAHQETRVIFEFPLEQESKERGPHPGPNPGSRVGSQEGARCPAGHEGVSVGSRRASRKTRSSSIGSLVARRGWRGATSAVVLGLFAVWMAMRGAHSAQTGVLASIARAMPPTRETIALPAFPAVVLRPSVVGASPPVPAAIATRAHGQSARHAHAVSVPLSLSDSRVAVRALVSASAPTVGPSAESAAPRAGRLSKDDF